MNIESSIPLPDNTGRGRPAKYPFARMQPGDSVFFPSGKTGGKEYLAAMAHGRGSGKRFTGRAVEGGLRIWRVE